MRLQRVPPDRPADGEPGEAIGRRRNGQPAPDCGVVGPAAQHEAPGVGVRGSHRLGDARGVLEGLRPLDLPQCRPEPVSGDLVNGRNGEPRPGLAVEPALVVGYRGELGGFRRHQELEHEPLRPAVEPVRELAQPTPLPRVHRRIPAGVVADQDLHIVRVVGVDNALGVAIAEVAEFGLAALLDGHGDLHAGCLRLGHEPATVFVVDEQHRTIGGDLGRRCDERVGDDSLGRDHGRVLLGRGLPGQVHEVAPQ